MDAFVRGQGDGEEGSEGAGGGQVDMNSPTAQSFVETLVNIGISETDARLAVRQTGAESAEAAINWVFENSDRDRAEELESGEELYQDYKMVFVINASLPMSPGKVAAQVGHAAIDLYRELISKQELFGGPMLQWSENGSKKIVLQAGNAEELVALAKRAEAAGLPYSAIHDAGRTQIPSGSHTVLAIFGLSGQVDKVTGHLKLL
jgi:PTH2 family peptidyl-tRNA hydrolase